MFPVTQLAAQCVLFSQCFGLSSSIRPGKPVLVDPTEKMLMPLQILWLHSFNGSEELGWISLWGDGYLTFTLLVHLAPQQSCSTSTQCSLPPAKSENICVLCLKTHNLNIPMSATFITHFFLGLIKALAYFCMLLFPILCHLCCFLPFNTTEDMTSG